MRPLFYGVLLLSLLNTSHLFAEPVRGDLRVSSQGIANLLNERDDLSPWMVVEVSWGKGKEYAQGHIPGAIHVNTDEIEYDEFKARTTTEPSKLGRSTTPAQDRAKGLSDSDVLPKNFWNLYPDRYLLPAFAHMGITRTSRVIVYSHDATAAARLSWALLYAGIQDLRIASGGLSAWKAAGLSVATAPTQRTPATNFGAERPRHPEYLATTPEVRDVVLKKRGNAVVVDIRTHGEYLGKEAPYSYIPTKGRIKGAIWGEAGKGPWTMESYTTPDGHLKAPHDVAAMWKKKGITREKAPIFYCGTAWRSSLAFLYAWMLDWQGMKNFDNSWYAWSMGPEKDQNPVE